MVSQDRRMDTSTNYPSTPKRASTNSLLAESPRRSPRFKRGFENPAENDIALNSEPVIRTTKFYSSSSKYLNPYERKVQHKPKPLFMKRRPSNPLPKEKREIAVLQAKRVTQKSVLSPDSVTPLNGSPKRKRNKPIYMPRSPKSKKVSPAKSKLTSPNSVLEMHADKKNHSGLTSDPGTQPAKKQKLGQTSKSPDSKKGDLRSSPVKFNYHRVLKIKPTPINGQDWFEDISDPTDASGVSSYLRNKSASSKSPAKISSPEKEQQEGLPRTPPRGNSNSTKRFFKSRSPSKIAAHLSTTLLTSGIFADQKKKYFRSSPKLPTAKLNKRGRGKGKVSQEHKNVKTRNFTRLMSHTPQRQENGIAVAADDSEDKEISFNIIQSAESPLVKPSSPLKGKNKGKPISSADTASKETVSIVTPTSESPLVRSPLVPNGKKRTVDTGGKGTGPNPNVTPTKNLVLPSSAPNGDTLAVSVRRSPRNKGNDVSKPTTSPVSAEAEKLRTNLFPIFSQSPHGRIGGKKQDSLVRSSPQFKRQKLFKDLVGTEQLIIDAGQKSLGPQTCATCGMLYSSCSADDVDLHLRHHAEFLGSLRFLGWKTENVVNQYPAGRVILVRPSDPAFMVRKIQEVCVIVDRDLGFVDPALPVEKGAGYLLYVSCDKKIIGCLIAEAISKAHVLLPPKEKSRTPGAYYCSEDSVPVECGINRIWTAPKWRRNKIATQLLDCLRCHFITGKVLSLSDFAFSAPTLSGQQFAEKYTGKKNFLVYK